MKYFNNRIIIDREICNGKPIIRGKRITVQTILEFLAAGNTAEEILAEYPSLEKEDITSCMNFAIKVVKQNYIIKPLTYV